MPIADSVDDGFARASALLNIGRPLEALPHAQRALAAQPDRRAHLLVAEVLLALDRCSEARDHARSAVARDPSDAEALSCLAAASAGCGDFDDAREASRAAIALVPGSAGLHLQQARICLTAKDTSTALRAALHAQSLDPAEAAIPATLAAVYTALGRREEAAAAAARALALDPASSESHRAAGWSDLFGRGGSAAIPRFRESLRLDPTDDHARSGMEVALRARNPVYAALMRYGLWMSRQSRGRQWAVRLAPFVLGRIAVAAHNTPLVVAVVALVLMTWAIEPITTLSLLASRKDRVFVAARARRSAAVFTALMVLAIAGLVAAGVSGFHEGVVLGIGIGLWALSAGSSDDLSPGRERIVLVGSGIAVVLAAAAAGLDLAIGEHDGHVAPVVVTLNAVVLITGIIATWFTALG